MTKKQSSQALPECPMAGLCAGMVETKSNRAGATFVGLFFIVLGLAAIIQPKVLVILVSALFIIIGFGIIMFVNRAKPMHPAG